MRESQDIYTENYKTALRETKESLNNWRDMLCAWTERFNIIKMSFHQNDLYGQGLHNQSPSSWGVFMCV